MTTNTAKPRTIAAYRRWVRSTLGFDVTRAVGAYYQSVSDRLKLDLEESNFWNEFVRYLPEAADKYLLHTTYPLFVSGPTTPTIYVKPFESLLIKTYRKNVLLNNRWPDPPDDGWITPANWVTRTNDVVRTMLVVKYLDGIKFLADAIAEFAMSHKVQTRVDFEAREEGYYAAHAYLIRKYEVPKRNWDTEWIQASFEIQITTQLQEVMRRLTHDYYEERRQRISAPEVKWQWDYQSEEFLPNYLGHILHYVEGMIMEVRERQRRADEK